MQVIIKKGTRPVSTNAPIDIRNIAAKISLNGTVITRLIEALLDSAAKTPARKAPIATNRIKPEQPNYIL